jgi:hypothetical protein
MINNISKELTPNIIYNGERMNYFPYIQKQGKYVYSHSHLNTISASQYSTGRKDIKRSCFDSRNLL